MKKFKVAQNVRKHILVLQYLKSDNFIFQNGDLVTLIAILECRLGLDQEFQIHF